MKNQKILVDREPLSKDFIKSKENFGHVLSQVKNLKPPVWKTPWFYGPVGIAVVAVTISAVRMNPTEINQKEAKFEEVVPAEKRKIEVQSIAMITPKEVEKPSVREIIPENKLKISTPKKAVVQNTNEIVEDNDEIENVIEKKIEQTEVPVPKRVSYPNINGVYTGEIAISKLREFKISCGELEIKSFSLQYYDGRKEVVKSVVGNKIPTEICDIIEDHNWGSMIFITKIMAVDSEHVTISLPSMSFIPH